MIAAFDRRITSSSSPDSSAAPVDAESASGISRKGLRSLVVCGSHFSHSSSRAHAGSVSATATSSLGE